MNNPKTPFVNILKRHFDPSIEMLKRLIEVCPETFWDHGDETISFWQHIYHTIQSIDSWFCQSHVELQETTFQPTIYAELDKVSHTSLNKEQVTNYLDNVSQKCERVFQEFDDTMLSWNLESKPSWTPCDVILVQIRHIQHHVGALNSLLHRAGYETVPWQGYGE